jgi:methylmalonyl-CoA/ethylmalonyl-CoA epimerase
VSAAHDVPSERVRVVFVPVGEPALELLEATSSESAIARFVDRHGPGLHHITLRVEDLDAALAELRQRGVKLIDAVPRAGAHGSRVAFIHPSAAGGVLVELKESARVPGDRA